MTLLAVDPGTISGIALFEHGEIIYTEEVTEKELLDFIKVNKPEVLVIESFLHYPWIKNSTVHTYPVAELIGKIKLLGDHFGLKIVTQPAGVVKKVVTNEALKHFGIKEYKSKHIMDALRHGIYYLKYRRKT